MTSTDETAHASKLAGIHPALASALSKQGYTALTPVQMAVLQPDLEPQDLLVSAQTGSGKTVAFGLAIAPTLLGDAKKFPPKGQPLSLVIAPTRELAIQVQRELTWLYADADVSTLSCVGGMDIQKERRLLSHGAHIVVGTPGRLRDHITRGALDLSAIRAVVLDEADEMLDMGFREDLEFILAATPSERRTLMFSATVPKPIAELAKTYQRKAIRLSTNEARERHADIDYQMIVAQSHERENAIINTLLYFDSGSAIVFCHTRESVKTLTTKLADHGFSVVTLSGEFSQAERSNALQAMRDGRARVCVATDVAARGIDLPNLDLVIHADVPSKPDTLLHRSGRTGRAGRKGVCALIVPVRRYASAMRVLSMANVTATTRNAPTEAEIQTRYRAHVLDTAAEAPMPDATEQALVSELLSRVSPEQLAAAYLRAQFEKYPSAAYISDTPLPTPFAKGKGREFGKEREFGKGRDFENSNRSGSSNAREPRSRDREDMTGSGWFSLSLGRKHRADPKWLLPMICKAGGVTKRDVGSIKIFETETRFEIASQKLDAFIEKVARDGSGEKGVTIAPSQQAPSEPRGDYSAPKKRDHERSEQRPRRIERVESVTTEPPEKPRPHQPARLSKPWKKSKPQTAGKGKSGHEHSKPKHAGGESASGVKPWASPAQKRKKKGGAKA